MGLVLFTVDVSLGADRGTITIQHRTRAVGPDIKLLDIARLEGKVANTLADVKVGEFEPRQPKQMITLAGVKKVLRQHDLNWSLLTLAGHTKCSVFRKQKSQTQDPHALDDTKTETDPLTSRTTSTIRKQSSSTQTSSTQNARQPSEQGSADSNLHQDISVSEPNTLRELVNSRIAQLAGKSKDQLDITYSKRDGNRLSQPLNGQRFELEPRSANRIGRIPIRIRAYEGVEITARYTVIAMVRWRTLGLVVTTRIDRNDALTAEDFEVREITFDDEKRKPLTRKDEVEGQVAATTLRSGEPLCVEDLKSPTLVERGQRITVRCLSGDLVIRTIARARADGTRGDVIKVRNLVSGDTYQAQVTGVREAVVQSNINAN